MEEAIENRSVLVMKWRNGENLGMQGTASSFLTDVNKILKELYTGEYTVEKTAEEIDQAWDREAQEE